MMARTLAKHALLSAVLTALPVLCSAQQKPFVMPLIPAADWRQVDSHVLPLSAVSQYGGMPAVEQEFGVKSLDLRTYQLGKVRTEVVVEVTPDATSAYGLLTFNETPAMTQEKDIQLTASDANETIMARGRDFIRFLHSQDSSLTPSDFHALLTFVGGSKPSASALSSLPSPMPAKGLVPGSEKYLLGLAAAKLVLPSFRTDLIGFDQGAEVQMGEYKIGKGTSTLVSINYPTPQIARRRFGSLSDLLRLNQDDGDDTVYGRRQGSYVFLALNTESPAAASALMDRFQVTEGLSWDQKYNPERTFTMQLVHMIFAILLLTVVLIGACLVAGVLFFLSRRIAAKFFPDSLWGHSDDDQLIRLNLKT
ncbi:MAG: DUF6599 family protein [Terriglobia bacterium]